MPSKAHSWGLKVFCHCNGNGFLHDFWIAGESSLEIKTNFGYNKCIRWSRPLNYVDVSYDNYVENYHDTGTAGFFTGCLCLPNPA
ncbi:hypothetical protein T4A_303 [Trichinella pseudospiralis]|uniref:Uncharacterized protein n=1 Tax=Trichinella pseudospiralis TaxID=6337 RepID=A0A0V1F198_TRIPS|nr:hypothetical protein T4A_303 [Trichinella pseudospiralis]